MSFTERTKNKISDAINSNPEEETILKFLKYFLMTGWLASSDATKKKFRNILEADIATAEEKSAEKNLLLVLKDVLESLEAINENPKPREEIYMQLFNLILTSFDLKEFYPPFVLDRFLLLCLVTGRPNLMSEVILQSYPLSKEILNELIKPTERR